ncbi:MULTISPECIES: diacylglycerol kinase family protein [Paraliobacillus]|uniref:diacylglycerol kinase family protein n=1 Tax=Paraliobacillus TaxID=200903 RepID=UPI000DD3242E|nr:MULTISPECIES: diacylglycerol kinase family protein [Paraliobacillus]
MASDYQGNKRSRLGLKYALNGIKYAVRSENNMKIHFVILLIVIGLGLAFQLSIVEWMLLSLTIGSVLICELLNTAIEDLLDYLAPEIHPTVGKIKDLTAGAVLIAALVSLIVGSLVFIPKILALF